MRSGSTDDLEHALVEPTGPAGQEEPLAVSGFDESVAGDAALGTQA